MLQLKNITKTYITGTLEQDALKDVSINFREGEFVSILGQSGSGKTTLLNIVGGLDRYTNGDLIINGVSTKQYKDIDWDIYRNHSVGFVFQSYNLIPHQSVLSNVELALTLAGISKKDRRQRAVSVLKKVGLEEHIHKKPNQMSGGQMQRVAIARALINNPHILLADEPTGALDSETSLQIMELLKEIAKDKLVIMVTHNPELAEQYSTRIIRLLDGNVTSDSNPYEITKPCNQEPKKKEKVSMSFLTALSLSFNNLKTKKGRTILTAFAGSIGIIGIALILSLSNGMQDYIASVEKDTLSSYPVSIQSQTIDLSTMMGQGKSNNSEDEISHDTDKIYQGGYAYDSLKRRTIQTLNNDLEEFKTYLDSSDGEDILSYTNAVQYGYDLDLQIYKSDSLDEIIKVNPSSILESQSNGPSGMNLMESMGATNEVFTEILGNEELISSQYDVLSGKWAAAYDEVVLVVDENNEISDMTLYSLGLKNRDELNEISEKIKIGEDVDNSDYKMASYSFDELLQLQYKLVLSTDYYQELNGTWINKSQDKNYMTDLLSNALSLKIVGIVKPSKDSVSASIGGTIGYTQALTEYVTNQVNSSKIVTFQMDNPNIDVFTGKEFATSEQTSNIDLMDSLTEEEQAYLGTLSEEERTIFLASRSTESNSTYENNMKTLGVIDLNKPSSINLYLNSFDSKDEMVDAIKRYNQNQIDLGYEDYVIEYTDIIGLITSSINSIINMITYLLIGFVSISLVVSSIMIGIITYISVLERTKEIGILRSIGASKKDISRVFNAETVIIGFSAGVLGILITVLLTIPTNKIIHSLSGVSEIAKLPLSGGITLIIISTLLTVIAGFIPAKVAAKKDPVEALRSE